MATMGATARKSPAARRGTPLLTAVAPQRRPDSAGRERALKVVTDSERRHHGIAAYFWVAVSAFAVALVVMVVSQVLLTQATFRTSEARSELGRAQAENERLRLEKARAESPTLLEERARRDLGMVPGQNPERLVLGPKTPNPLPLGPVTDYGQAPAPPLPEVAPAPAKSKSQPAKVPTASSTAKKAASTPRPAPTPTKAAKR